MYYADSSNREAAGLHSDDGVSVVTMLRKAGLRPTRQRIALAELLFGAGHRHLTAEMLHEDAMRESVAVSLATIYNTLHQFTAAGFLREVIVDGSKTYFDTNVSAHHHFFVEDTGEIIDVPGDDPVLTKLPAAPAGMKVSRVDVIVRVRRVGH